MLTCLIIAGGAGIPPQRRRVLVVEDDVQTRVAMARLLRGWGLEVRAVGSVAGAITELGWASCVVLDLALTDGSGLAVLEHVRANALAVRVAVVTAAADPAALAAARQLRPELLLLKPLDADKLAEFLATC
jgi:CheY-like chemotaxis protein